jgi:hypothetical protein
MGNKETPYLNKLFRIFTVTIIAFGWLFMSPIGAYSDDPITIGAQRLEVLNEQVSDLTDSADLVSLIDIAQDKYDEAVISRDNKISADEDYDEAVQLEANKLSLLNTAKDELDSEKSAVDAQTPIVSTALTNKNNAKDSLDVSAINLSTANTNVQTTQAAIQSANSQGLQFTAYNLLRNGSVAVPGSVICTGKWNSNSMNLPVCGRYENIIVKFTGVITVPSWFTSTYFAGSTDDGFRMYVNGDLAVDNWVEQGVTWSNYSPVYDVSQDKTLDVEIWWYNGGGPGSYHLGWAIPGGWTGAGCDYAGNPRVWGQNFSCNLDTFSSGSGPTQAQTDAYNDAVAAKTVAQTDYNNKLTTYNDKSLIHSQESTKLQTMQSTLNTKQTNKNNAQTAYEDAQEDAENKLNDKEDASDEYNQSIIDMNDALAAAEEEYIAQFDFEEKQRISAAIAQAAANAAANQPTPTPSPEPTEEPTPEPSPDATTDPEPIPDPTPDATPDPEPTPEPTVDPTEEPTPEPTPEVTPDPEPTEEPVVEPTEEPITEPSPEPGPDPEPEDNPWTEPDTEIKDEVLEALVPEKGTGTEQDLSNVIANLTSKDNKLVKLSAEQITAVSQTLRALTQEAKQEVAEDLGIKASEVSQIAEQMKSNPELASAFVEFSERAGDAGEAPMPFTLADAVTEVQTEAFLADPLGAVFEVDVTELLSNFSELGMDMTDDQREKAQEVIIPVIIVSQIASVMIGMRR